MDVRLGDRSGFEAAWAIRREVPRAKVLLVSSADFRHCRERMRESGAHGFVRKSRLASVDLSEYWPIPEQALGRSTNLELSDRTVGGQADEAA
jgi:hypothetical protein